MGKKGILLEQHLLSLCWDAAVFSWIGAPSKGQVTPATIKLPSLYFCHHLTGFPSPQHAFGRAQPSPSCPAMASPSGDHGPARPRSSACASSRTCSRGARRATWVSRAITGPCPSVWASRPPHQPAGLAEGLLLTAHTFGLTVNNKTKSLCTALQTLLHSPG